MGLITKIVKVKWCNKTKKWYESKGYVFTEWYDEFECKVIDLSKGSNIKVEVECDGDNCNKISHVAWFDYLKFKHENNKYYCRKCGKNIFGNKKQKETQLKNSKSFYTWCYDNLNKDEANNIMDRWDYKLNKCNPKDVCYSSIGLNGKGYWFKCNKYKEHESELHSISKFTYNRKGSLNCNQCNSFYTWVYENLDKEKADDIINRWDYNLNKCSPKEVCYGANGINKKGYYFKCLKHPEHKSELHSIQSFVNKIKKYKKSNILECKQCNSFAQWGIDNIDKNFLEKYWSNKNILNPWGTNKKSDTHPIWIKCQGKNYHNDYKTTCYNFTINERCPKCAQEKNESILQEKVRLYLENLNIGQVLHEHNCTIVPKNPKTKYPLPFDNELIINNKINLIIEIHGKQHYEITGFHEMSAKHNNTTLDYELHYQKLKDRYKRIYAKSKGYYYLAIPYWTDNEQEEWKILINNKINKMLNERE